MGKGQVLSHIFIMIIMFCNFQTQCLSHGGHFLCHPDQSLALLQFKSHFVINPSASSFCALQYVLPNQESSPMPHTGNWSEGTHLRTGTWNVSTDCCSSWDGVTCNAVTGQVIGLDLSCSMLKLQDSSSRVSSGIFSSLFASIPNLQILNLAHNDLQSLSMSSHDQFSLGFASLPSLTHLNVSHSYLSGYVPSEISYLSKLVSLDLSWNFDLRIRSATVLKSMTQNLTQLRVLNLEKTSLLALSDSASSLMNLSSSLTSLSLSNSGLQGNFPESFLLLPNLLELHLSGNSNLSGSLPKLSNSTSLRVLQLAGTSLSGELPAGSIGNLKSLQVLDLSSCNFSGTVPASLGNLTQITQLYISNNHFSGAIPSSLGYLSQLYYLDLGWNTLTGQVPKAILNLTRLYTLDLSSNQLEGSLPTSRGQPFPYLSSIYLSRNSLNGTIPSWLFALPLLRDIRLYSNHLSGPLSEFLSPSLSSLDLSNNELNGSIPIPISRSASLSSLSLYENFLTGSVGKLPDIQVLDLHSNLLKGSVPVPSTKTVYFSISNNSFTGALPSLVCNALSLEVLDLSFNRLSGTIPQCLGNVSTSLSVLNLCMNNFHGTVPDTFEKGTELTYLNLNGNQLGGVLPRSLANCEKLKALDLDNNSIADVFPGWMQTLSQLQVLVLRSNKFHGSVDIDLGMSHSFPMLRILDLSNNNFSGAISTRLVQSFKSMIHTSEDQRIPQYMGSDGTYSAYKFSVTVTIKAVQIQLVKILTIFTTIDMSSNKFDGNIPLEIGSLHALKGLNLSHNNLAGPIPTSFGELANLEWLDLSSNELTGRIPIQLANLNFLAVLNLSHNHLHGPIPQGTQLNTFGVESYAGNSGLCGFPLPTCGRDNSNPPTQSASSDDSNFAFSWKSSYIGYGCGTLYGMAMGYLVFSTGSPHWFVKMVEGERQTKARRLHRNAKARARRATS